MKIIFFGTPEFASYSLRSILASGHEVAAVVTMPDKAAGRGHRLLYSDVKKVALEYNLPLLQPERLRDPEFLDRLQGFGADLFVVIAFRMLPRVVWDMPPMGTFNLHASLLPSYRGAAPINRAIMNGETSTGITTFFLSESIDTGDVIESRSVEILPSHNAGSLHDKLAILGAEMTVHTLDAIEKGNIKTHPQPEGEYVPAPKIFREDCQINWRHDAVRIHNQVRGLSPYPAAFASFEIENKGGMQLKIFSTEICPDVKGLEPGEVLVEKDNLYVGSSTCAVRLLQLQPAGKKPMDAASFLRGYTPLRTLES